MKKNMLIMFVVIACAAIASSAFAGITISTGNTTMIGGANFVPSTNVSLTASADDTHYCVTSAHSSSLLQSSGREWGSYTGGASAIYYKSTAAISTLDSCGSTNSDLPGGVASWQAQ